MSSYLGKYAASRGLAVAPYVFLLSRTACSYIVPWFAPVIRFEKQDTGSSATKSHGKVMGTHSTENLDELSSEGDDSSFEIIEMPLEDIIEPVKGDQGNGMKLIPYCPPVVISLPTMSDIGSRALTATMVDLPIYAIKYFYGSPMQTMFLLYTVLPAPVWEAVVPRIIYYLAWLL
jgi:hypothetical protein